jgi:hypothetical protein
MVAHSGFITAARKVEPGLWTSPHQRELVSEVGLEETHEEDQDE